jgi:hypothetical protein
LLVRRRQVKDVNQEAHTAQGKPVLNREDFQRLLAAAYLLQAHPLQAHHIQAQYVQAHYDCQPSIRPVEPVSASPASSFAARAILQKRTPSAMIRERQIQAGQPVPGDVAAKHPYPVRLVRFVGSTVPHRINILLRRSMSWRTVEALAIAIVFFMMMGMSIHRLSAIRGRTSLASGMPEEQNDGQLAGPTQKALASPSPVATLNSRPSPSESDIVAQDIVIRHQKRVANLPAQPGVRFTSGRDADAFAADTVVQYGSDVKMWSRKPARAPLNRSGQ